MFGRFANSRYRTFRQPRPKLGLLLQSWSTGVGRHLYGSEKSGAEIKTIRHEREHAEQGDKQANAAEYGNYL
jgi:hypothetical protein